MDTRRNYTVDLVRALACILVMAHHAAQHFRADAFWEKAIRGIFICGNSGVQIFFVLSGFLLAEPFWRAYLLNQKCPSLRVYGIRRWARIAPAFWLNLTLCFALSLLFQDKGDFLVERYISGITFTAGFSWTTLFPTGINGPLWSVGFEVISYGLLALVALFWFFINARRSLFSGLLYWTISLALTLILHILFLRFGMTDSTNKGLSFGVLGVAKDWWPYYNPIGFFSVFSVGIIGSGIECALKLGKIQIEEKARRNLLYLGLVMILIGYVGYGSLGPYGYRMSIPPMPYMFPILPIGIVLVLLFGDSFVKLAKLARSKLVHTIAELSYGLYLYHYLVMSLFIRLFFHVDNSNILMWFLQFLLTYSIAFLIAFLSWHFFEKKIVSWAHNVTRRTGGNRTS